MKRTSLLFALTTALMSSTVYAAALVPASDHIQYLDSTLHSLKTHAAIPVIFPTKIPEPNKNVSYFASSAVPSSGGYSIFVDNTADCHGTHYCNVATVNAEIGGNPIIYYSANNKELTQTVNLGRGIKAYYTPSHAMADNWPTQITWRNKAVLYTITWNLSANNEKQTMLALADSAIKNSVSPR